MYLQQHIQTAIKVIESYKQDIPFAAYLKQYFAANKKHGSKDRKFISQFCYAYFRLGKSIPADFDKTERMQIGIFLSEYAERFSLLFDEEERIIYPRNISEKIEYVRNKYPLFDASHIFPYPEQVSEEIDVNTFSLSHLIQPDVFLRIRPGRKETVEKNLQAQAIEYGIDDMTVRVSANSKVDTAVHINRDVVVQDKSSQQIGELLQHVATRDKISLWDCCAASGGKSILAVDTFKERNVKVELTVSDVRESILHNLKKRFTEAGISNYHSFVGDLTKQISLTTVKKFDLIICDAPCSGSGTWGRTPEQLVFFSEEKIEYYQSVQKAISDKAMTYLQPSGYFLYITCSVFKAENEEVVNYLTNKGGLALLEMKYYTGYGEKADTLFAALLTPSKV